jgi:hypothetical protein
MPSMSRSTAVSPVKWDDFDANTLGVIVKDLGLKTNGKREEMLQALKLEELYPSSRFPYGQDAVVIGFVTDSL